MRGAGFSAEGAIQETDRVTANSPIMTGEGGAHAAIAQCRNRPFRMEHEGALSVH